MRTTKITITQSTDVWRRDKISVMNATLYIAKQAGLYKELKCFQCSFDSDPKLCNAHACEHPNSIVWIKAN